MSLGGSALDSDLGQIAALREVKRSAHERVVRPAGMIPHRHSHAADNPARPPLAHVERRTQTSDSLSLGSGRHHFFPSRKGIAIVAAVSLVTAYSIPWPVDAAEQTQIPSNPKVHIQYAAPKDNVFTALREEYREFLSPLQFKQDLTVSTEECPDVRVNSDYNSAKHYIRICYEYIAMVENEAAVPTDQLPPLVGWRGSVAGI
jgi:hypothetical protein